MLSFTTVGNKVTMKKHQTLSNAGLLPRFGALIYDGCFIIAIEMLAAGVVIATLEALVAMNWFSYAEYSNFSDYLTLHPTWSFVFSAYLGAIWLGFFAYFWSVDGQTYGMRACRIRVQNQDGSNIKITQALIRAGTSVFGLGNLTVLIDPQRRAFQDIWASTQVVEVPKTPSSLR